ncbi:hypothetical protein ACHQM5_029495 [Ranunculus cassubicifolius]
MDNALSKLQNTSRINKRAAEEDLPLPHLKVSNSCNQLARSADVKKPFDLVPLMDKPTDGESPAIAKALGLKNDFFSVVMLPSYRCYLPVPSGFARKYFPQNLENVKLSYSGKTWTLGCYNAQNLYKLVKGWRACRREMKVEDNNICVFEMSQGEEIVLKVHIISERKSIYETGTSSSGNDDDDDSQILSIDESNIDSKTSVAASLGNMKMRNALYNHIVSRYGHLEGGSSTSLSVTKAMTGDILKLISEMVKTNPSELSDLMLTNWENTVQTAAAINFNVGWLADILAQFRKNFDSNVKLLQEMQCEFQII